MITSVPANDIGLFGCDTWDSSLRRDSLEDQGRKLGFLVETVQIPLIAGPEGCARLLGYTSRNTGKPVTVLVIPRCGMDSTLAEDYFYFDMSLDTATALGEPAWLKRYDESLRLQEEAYRNIG